MLRFIKSRRSADPSTKSDRNKPNGILPPVAETSIPEYTEPISFTEPAIDNHPIKPLPEQLQNNPPLSQENQPEPYNTRNPTTLKDVRQEAADIVDNIMGNSADDIIMPDDLSSNQDDAHSDVTGTTIRSADFGMKTPPSDQNMQLSNRSQHPSLYDAGDFNQNTPDKQMEIYVPPQRRSLTPSQHSNHSNPSVTSSVHANGILGNGYYGSGLYVQQSEQPSTDMVYPKAEADYPYTGYKKKVRKDRPMTNSFRLAMNRDGSMSVLSDVPIITSHYYIDEDNPPLKHPYPCHPQQMYPLPHHPTKRQVHFNPHHKRPRYRHGYPGYPTTLYPVIDDVDGYSSNLSDDDDCVSVGSNISQSEIGPSKMSLRRSIALFCSWICLGLSYEVTGPMFNYLTAALNILHFEASWALASRGGGVVIGALIGWLMCYKRSDWKDLWMTFGFMLCAISSAASPWCPELMYLGIVLGFMGIAKGLIIVVSLLFVHYLWIESKAYLLVFILFAAYFLGAMITPHLAYWFGTLTAVNSTSLNPQYFSGSDVTRETMNNSISANLTYVSSLEMLHVIPTPMYPMCIPAVFCFLCAAVFLGFFAASLKNVQITKSTESIPLSSENVKTKDVELRCKTENIEEAQGTAYEEIDGHKKKQNGVISNGQEVERNPTKEAANQLNESLKEEDREPMCCKRACSSRLLLYLLVLLLTPAGLLLSCGHLLFFYLQDDVIGFSQSNAVNLLSLFWLCSALGCIFPPVARRCGFAANGLLITSFTLCLLSISVLTVYAESYPVIIWIFISLWGSFIGSLLPIGLTYANIFLASTPAGLCLAVICFGLGEAAFAALSVFLMARFGLRVLVYMWLAASGFCFLFHVPLLPLLADRKWRVNKKNNKNRKGNKNVKKHIINGNKNYV